MFDEQIRELLPADTGRSVTKPVLCLSSILKSANFRSTTEISKQIKKHFYDPIFFFAKTVPFLRLLKQNIYISFSKLNCPEKISPLRPCKRTQHCWPTTPNIVGPNSVVTCCVRLHGTTTMLALVGTCCVQFETGQTFGPTSPNIFIVL